MILLYAILLSITVALVRGGRFDRLAALSLRYGWVALLAFGLQIAIIYFPTAKSAGPFGVRTLLLALSYALLGIVIVSNRHLPGLVPIGVGFALNLAVMLANGGFMPITPDTLEAAGLGHLALGSEAGSRVLNAKDILLAREDTRLWVLSDILVMPYPKAAFSIGDVFLGIGGFWLFQRGMRPNPVAPALGQSSDEGESCATRRA